MAHLTWSWGSRRPSCINTFKNVQYNSLKRVSTREQTVYPGGGWHVMEATSCKVTREALQHISWNHCTTVTTNESCPSYLSPPFAVNLTTLEKKVRNQYSREGTVWTWSTGHHGGTLNLNSTESISFWEAGLSKKTISECYQDNNENGFIYLNTCCWNSRKAHDPMLCIRHCVKDLVAEEYKSEEGIKTCTKGAQVERRQ